MTIAYNNNNNSDEHIFNSTNLDEINLFEWQQTREFSLFFIKGLIDVITKQEIKEQKNINIKYAAKAASEILNYILNKIQHKGKYNYVIISSKEIEFETLIQKNVISSALSLLRKAGCISTDRKSINGNNKYYINTFRIKEIEAAGKIIDEQERKLFYNERSEVLKESVIKIKENKSKNFKWSKEKADAINKMAYDKIIDEDVYNTGLLKCEREIIQHISKAWFKYTNDYLIWDYKMFNKIRFVIAGDYLKNFKNKTSYYYNLILQANPQKLEDIVMFIHSIWFRPLTGCSSSVVEIMFTDAWNKGFKKIVPLLYDASSYEGLYKGESFPKDYDKFYEVKINPLRKRVVLSRNLFNDINPNDKDYRIRDIVSSIPFKNVREKLFKDYEKIHPSMNRNSMDYYKPSTTQEDPCALFKSLK